MDDYVYIIGFSDGIVKIGRTVRPERRILEHGWAAGHDDATVTRWMFVKHENTYLMEQTMRMIGRRWSERAWGNEYFRDDFDAFVQKIIHYSPFIGLCRLSGVIQPMTPLQEVAMLEGSYNWFMKRTGAQAV